MARWLPRWPQVGALLGAMTVVAVSVSQAGAADDPARQREQVRAQRAALAAQIDTLQATDEEVSAALEDLNAHVRTQEALLADAQRALATATATAQLAASEEQRAADTVVALQTRARELSVGAYVSRPVNPALAFLTADGPRQASAVQSLAELETRRLQDSVDAVRAARHDVEGWRAQADAAQAEADARRAEVAERLTSLEGARDAQQALVDQVQDRIDDALAEADALAELDRKLSEEIARRQAELARRMAVAARGRSSGAAGGPVAAPGDIENASGIWVHRSIAAQVRALLAAAAADGISLGGGGYRNTANQIALRQAHCGTSQYAIYEMPSGRCHPPTAPPGRSQHERGLAIDFTCNGTVIGSRSSACFRWLAANAGSYGLINLPSEPWHWSTTGR